MTQKKRRNKEEIEKDVMQAVRLLVDDVGFRNVTFVGIAEKSKTDMTVLSANYGTLEMLLSTFAKKYRFWFLNAVAHATSSKTQTEINYIKNLTSQLINDSFDNKTVSQILRWELAENNTTTEQLIQSKEAFYKTIYYNLYKVRTEHPDTHILLALLIGGIYYTALIKDKSSYWGTDYNNKTNKKKLLDVVNNIIDRMLSDDLPKMEVIEIARRFKAKNIDIQTIAECTGLSTELIDEL